MAEWDPEVEVDPALARRLIDERVPELRGAPVRLLDAGWDNVVYLVDERWAFRFPRRAIAVPGVEREIAALGRLAAHLPLPIPEPRWVGAPTAAFGWPWFGTPYLPGTELAAAGLPDERRVPLAASLGAFLRALHASRLVRLLGAGLPVDPNRRADMSWRVPMARERLATLRDVDGYEPPDALNRLLADAERLPPPSRTRVLHGDLHARHVLVDESGAPSGVIDWGDVCIGDPSVDLSIGYAAFVGQARAAFLAAYGRVDRVTELRARALAASLCATLLEYAIDTGMAGLRDDARRSLDRLVA